MTGVLRIALALARNEVLPCLSLLGQRGLKKSAQDVRSGEVVTRDGKPWKVTKFTREHGMARASGYAVLDFQDLATQARTSEKFRLDDQLEVVELDTKQMQVVYVEGNTVHLLDPDTFEQTEVDVGVFGDAKRWLSTPDLEVECKLHESRVATGALPFKLVVKVLEAAMPVAREDGSTNRHVLVEGGINVLVPGHVKTGDRIVVRSQDGTYMSKQT